MEYETHSWMNPYYNSDTTNYESEYDPGVNPDLPYNETDLGNTTDAEYYFRWMGFLLIVSSILCGCMRGAHIDFRNRSTGNTRRNSITTRESDLATYLIEHTHPGSGDEEDINDKDNDTCAICIEPFSSKNTNIILDCGHKFHSSCIITWFKKELTCPICRKPVQPN